MSMSRFLRALAAVLIAIIGVYIFWVARSVFVSAFAAILFAVGITVVANWFQQLALGRGISIALSLIVIVFGIFLILMLILPAIIEQGTQLVQDLPNYLSTAVLNYEALRNSSSFWVDILPELPANLVSTTTGALTEAGTGATASWLTRGMVIPLVSGLGSMVTVIFNFALYFLIAIWFAVDPKSYRHALEFLVPREKQQRVIEIWGILYDNLHIWIRAQSLSIGLTSALVYVVLGIFMGLPYAIVIAVLAGVATLIPNIGAFIPILPIAVFGLASDTPERTIWWLLVYLLLQLIESNLLTPSIVKIELNIPAGAMMIFQLIIALIFGPLAMLLSVPFFTVLIVLVRELYSYDILGLRPTPVLVAATAPSPSPATRQSSIPNRSAPGESL